VKQEQLMRDALFITLQHILPQHFLSRLVLRLTRVRTAWIKNPLITSFVRAFKPDTREAAEPNPRNYGSFNEFFTRSLRAGARPVDPDAHTLVSPVDGTVSQIGTLEGSELLQAKGHIYTLEALLADPRAAEYFKGGNFATLYLAPHNYHRIHMPLDGTLRAAWFVPGRLFSVNATTAASVPNLFAVNERVICLFDSGSAAFALVLVGALFVGSIATVWHGDITPYGPRRLTQLPLEGSRSPLALQKGAEMGRFNMGSTVILLTPAGFSHWLPAFSAGSRIRMGEALARVGAG
jgi:phosphatidylserine decarboxylase